MKKSLFAIALACSALSGCAALGGIPTSPGAVSDLTTADERAGIAVETMYAAAARAGTLAFEAKLVTPSTDSAVYAADFCDRVVAGSYRVAAGDRGAGLRAAECRLRYARDATRRAYDAGNATTFRAAADQAVALGLDLLALIKGN